MRLGKRRDTVREGLVGPVAAGKRRDMESRYIGDSKNLLFSRTSGTGVTFIQDHGTARKQNDGAA